MSGTKYSRHNEAWNILTGEDLPERMQKTFGHECVLSWTVDRSTTKLFLSGSIVWDGGRKTEFLVLKESQLEYGRASCIPTPSRTCSRKGAT